MHRHHPPASAPTNHATVRLGTVVSLIAALAAVVLRTFTDVSEPALVVAVMIGAFGLSWHVTWRGERNDFTRS